MSDPFADIRCPCGWVHYDFTLCPSETTPRGAAEAITAPIIKRLDETLELLMGSR